MNTQEQVNPAEASQQIWDQLDAEESGQAPATDESLIQTGESQEANNGAPVEQSTYEAVAVDETSADQALMDKIVGLEQMLNQVTTRLRNAEGHIGGLGSQLKQQVHAAQQITTRGGEAPSATEISAAQRSPKAMEELKRDYPEFAGAMEAALDSRLAQLEQGMQAQQQQPQGVQQVDINKLRAEIQVDVHYPGWQETVRAPEFTGWLQRQPREVQMLAASESPQDAIRLLDLHEESFRNVPDLQTKRLQSAAAIPSGRSGSSVRTKAIEDMTPQEYWQYLDQLDKQKA